MNIAFMRHTALRGGLLALATVTLQCAPANRVTAPPTAVASSQPKAAEGPESGPTAAETSSVNSDALASISTLEDPNDALAVQVARMAKVSAAWSPSFSPDGKQIAFISNLTGIPQVWTVPAAGGWPRLVTALNDQVSGVSWSPDGEWLAFSMAPGGGMNSQVYLIRPDGTDLRRLTDGGKDNNWLGDWTHDGRRLLIASSRRDPKTVDAWYYDIAASKLVLVAENPGIGVTADLSRDGRRAVIWRMQSRSSTDLVLRDLEANKETVLTPHEGPGESDGGLFSPSGRTVWLTTNVGRDRTAFGRIRLDAQGQPGPIKTLLARDDAEAGGFVLDHKGRTAALVWNVAGRNELELVNLRTMARRRVKRLPGEIIRGLTFSADNRQLAMNISGATRPNDIWILDTRTLRLRQLTFSPHAGIKLDDLVRPELMTYKAHDGLPLSGWLYRPKGVNGPAPFVLSFHGGPEGQEVPRFRSDYQALAARGIGVFAPNVRGSAGFGKRFVNLDNGKLRFDGIRDIESTVKYLVEAQIARADSLGIMGGSYGGYMTMAGLAFYPKMFAAGANLFGIVNFETFFKQTEPWMAAISTIEYGDPKTEAKLLRDLSPIHKIGDIVAPTIVLHGANDTNVPVIEAEQVVADLRSRDVPVQYVLFPDEGHGFRKTNNRITSAVSVVRWFEQHLKRRGATP